MESQKSNKALIGILITIIVLLICAVFYLLLGHELLNKEDDTFTTTNKINQNTEIRYHIEKTKIIANCVDSQNDNYNCPSDFEDGIKLEYPVFDGKTETINNINKKISASVNKNIEDIENYPNIINNVADANCLALKLSSSDKLIDFEELIIGKYLVMDSSKYFSILNIDDIKGICTSGDYYLKEIIVYDKVNDKIMSQDDIKNTIVNDKFNDLENIYYDDSFYLYYNKNGNLSSIGYQKENPELLQIYELVNNQWKLMAAGYEIWE